MTDTVDKVTIESEVKGASATAADLNKVSGALDGVTVASDKVEKSTSSIEGKFASLERRFQTSAGQASQFEKIQSQVNLAVKQNPELQDRANSVLAAAEARYLGAGAAVKALAAAHTGLDSQGQAALHSVRSVVEQLALGIPPTQALTGQINHLTYAATGEGGLAGAFKQVGGLIGGLITPTNAAIAGTVALAAAAAALAVQYDKVQVSSQRALIGAGARTGTSVSDLNTFTSENSGLAGTGLSAKEARGLGEDFTKTGEIVISRLHGMSDAVVGFANQTGKSIDEAKKDLVGFAVDPQKGLEELSKTFGSFDVATRQAVDELVRAGDKTGAFQLVIDALSEKSKKAAENMGVFEKATRSVVNVLASETVKPSGLENQLEAARAKLNAAIEGAPAGSDARAGAASADIARLSKEFETLQAAMEKVKAANVSAEFDKLSTAADAVDKAIVPQIAQIEKLKDALAELDRAKAAGATSKFGAEVDNAAALAITNQIVALEEAQAQAARYNRELANISLAWGGVSQSTALALQAAQNQLPVIQAITAQEQMAAQAAADYANAVQRGVAPLDAAELATEKLVASQEAATAAVEKQIRSLKDENEMIKARANGTEGATAAAQAYTHAIESGASQTSAAALSAQTLSNYTAQAAANAAKFGSNMVSANAGLTYAAGKIQQTISAQQGTAMAEAENAQFLDPRASSFTATIMPSGPLGFSGSMDAGVNDIITQLHMQATQESRGIAGLVNSAYAGGSITAALDAIKNGPNTFGADPTLASMPQKTGGHSSPIDFAGILGAQRTTDSDKISNYDSLVQLQNAQTNDKGTQVSNLQSEMAWLQTLPETIARDQKIVSLQQSIDALKNSTDANTAATSATLNPLYSQGHGALAIGYYKAAGGLDMMAHGPTSGDQIPFHAMVNGGERITITPPGKSGNDNSRQVINNNNFVFNNATSSNARRSFRQFSQGFGQIAAAGS